MKKINIKIKSGGALFDPVSRILLKSDSVHSVTESTFWRRRLKDGDIELVTETASKKENKKEKEKDK